jgi:uncharacterized protein (DUF433 family)
MDLSLKEAAAIVDLPEPFVRKAIESKTLRPRSVSSGRAVRYRFALDDMLFLKLIGEFPLGLDRDDKAALRVLVEGERKTSGKWRAEGPDLIVQSGDLVITVEMKTARDALAKNIATYTRGRRRIVSKPSVLGGEPVFEGTRIPIAQVAGLIAKGVSLGEIAQDYPALTGEDLAFAAIHAKMKRNPGRPRTPLRIRRKKLPPARAATRRRS